MWLYFNSNGQLTTTLEHGSPARVGSTDFSIFAVFEGLDENNISDYMATILLRKPDLTGSTYPTLLMQIASAEFIQGTGELNTGDFVSGRTYYGFLFDFGDFDYDPNDDDEIVLLDTDGLWQATINLIRENYNVQGVATFNVGGTGTETETEVSYTIITNQLVHEINKRALKTQTIISRSYEAIVTNLGDYENGQMFYAIDTHRMYQKVGGELEEIGTYNVDSSLSLTSENPVENKVITSELKNMHEILEGKCKTYVLGYSWDLTWLRNQINQINAIVVDYQDNDITSEVLSHSYDDAEILNSQFNNNENEEIDIGGIPDEKWFVIVVKNNDIYYDGEPITYKLLNTSVNAKANGLKMGDIFIVIETEVPDRWLGSESLWYCYPMESTKVSQANMVTTDTDQTITGTKTIGNGNKLIFGHSTYSDYWIRNGSGNVDIGTGEGNTIVRVSTSGIQVDQNVVPFANNSKDLGSSTYKWRDLYLEKRIYCDEVKTNYIGKAGVDLLFNGKDFRPEITNSNSLGTSSYAWKDLYLSDLISMKHPSASYTYVIEVQSNNNLRIRSAEGNGIQITAGKSLLPCANGDHDLGASYLKWKDFYISGNITDGTNSATVASLISGRAPISEHTISDGVSTEKLVIVSMYGTQTTSMNDLIFDLLDYPVINMYVAKTTSASNVYSNLHSPVVWYQVNENTLVVTIKYFDENGTLTTLIFDPQEQGFTYSDTVTSM